MRGNIKVVQNKIIARKRKQLIYKFIFTIFFLAVAFFGAGRISQLSFFGIKNIKVEDAAAGAMVGTGSATVDKASAISAEAIARQEISGSYWYIFSRSNIFLYPKQIILDRIAESSLIQDVYIETDGLDTITIFIKERAEAMQWCDDGVNALCFSADENGFIYEPSISTSTPASSHESIIFRGTLAGGPIGEYIMPTEDFKRIQFFLSQLGSIGVTVREVVIGETSYITVILSGGGRLIINSIDDLSAVLSNLDSILKDKSTASSSEGFLNSLDYMRLDSGNKIFFKVKSAQ